VVKYLGFRFLLACLPAIIVLPSAAQSQVAPTSPIHTAVNGVFFLCPHLVQQGTAPPTIDVSKLGFETTAPLIPGQFWYKGDGGKGTLTVSYNPAEKRCTLDYLGIGYEQIAGVARDTVKGNGFKWITGGDRDGAKGDVFEGPAPGSGKIARIIIIENYTGHSAAISYAER